ncbi:MAG: glutamine-hydrolyzing GMP synthase [Candidatus Peregrinibacteria bacterium]|nr:glutamine-hydrolyzing GMP synthase [Candidatus Peregrinibacteria bacterium]MDZ4244840.1 glutamine-hydrolyzing GMP synthase [Candidatus Gracilibacteria bacterium]
MAIEGLDKIAILDFGSQFAHLLTNRVRRLKVYSEMRDADTAASELKDYKGIIISGGPASVNDPTSPQIDPAIFELGIPILGVCYGHQLTMRTLGGRVQKGTVGEYGLTEFTVKKAEGVLNKLTEGETYQVYASHFDTVAELPEGFESMGSTPDDALSSTANFERNIYTVQFHPEVTHSECGMQILDAFIDITGATREWSIEKFIEMEIAAITEKVGDKKVFLLISGGVDSSVAYALLAKAIGADRIYAMYVDTGFMRKNETEEIQKFLGEAGVKGLHTYSAAGKYFDALKEVYEPEAKRKIIGDMFLKIQREVASKLELNPEEWLLGQGTIYPDTIESGGTKNADKIKTHHNRVPEIEELIRQGRIIEPIKELYKDEVRMVGRKLGLPDKMIDRHPFPGPGLAVRCLCLDKADEVPNSEALENKIDLEFPGLNPKILPVKSVGVQGDERTYRHPVVINPDVHSWDMIRSVSPKLTNAFSDINRVLVTVAVSVDMDMPIDTFSITPSYLTPQRTLKLQEADKLVMDFVYSVDVDKKVWQCPTVLLPLSVNSEGQESIVIRPVSSTEAMTANFTELPWEKVQELAREILKIEGISAVFYDVTNKPPGTIEWE